MKTLKELIELAKEAEGLQGMKETHKSLGRRIELIEAKLAKAGFGPVDHGTLFPEMLIATDEEWANGKEPKEKNPEKQHTVQNSFPSGTRPRTIIEGKEHVLYLSLGYIATARKLRLGRIEWNGKFKQDVLWCRPCDVPRIRFNDKNRRAK